MLSITPVATKSFNSSRLSIFVFNNILSDYFLKSSTLSKIIHGHKSTVAIEEHGQKGMLVCMPWSERNIKTHPYYSSLLLCMYVCMVKKDRQFGSFGSVSYVSGPYPIASVWFYLLFILEILEIIEIYIYIYKYMLSNNVSIVVGSHKMYRFYLVCM
jgi:hypothetical protein